MIQAIKKKILPLIEVRYEDVGIGPYEYGGDKRIDKVIEPIIDYGQVEVEFTLSSESWQIIGRFFKKSYSLGELKNRIPVNTLILHEIDEVRSVRVLVSLVDSRLDLENQKVIATYEWGE